MWTSQTMTFYESLITFSIGFSVVFICLVALAIFILLSSKIIGMLNSAVPEEKKTTVIDSISKPVSSSTPVVKDNQEELENLAVIISVISEEMREPVENFEIISIKEI